MARHTFNVTGSSEPVRIDAFLSKQNEMPSRSRLKALFESGLVRLNGEPIKPSAKVAQGDVVVVELPAAVPSALKPEALELPIIHEDSEGRDAIRELWNDLLDCIETGKRPSSDIENGLSSVAT